MTATLGPAASIDSVSGDPAADQSTSGAKHVANQADEPGHDDEFDVTNIGIEGEVCIFRTNADGLQVTGPCRILGYVVKTVTATAEVHVKDGIDNTGSYKFPIPIGKAVDTHLFGGVGIKCLTGAYLDFQTSATGSVALIVALGAGAEIAES